ncbi:MAG: transglycosylase SLT domain-containing protein [Pseudomonadota bacterium]
MLLPAPLHAGEIANLVVLAEPADAPTVAPSLADATPLEQESIGNYGTEISYDLTVPIDDVWERIRNGFALPDIDNDLVREQEDWYASRPDYVTRMVERSRRYLYYIVEELEKRGMPTEIALLPMIESAYNPGAYSRSHAAGIWQFIPSTGKTYGLEQNWWYDGRRDVMAATDAALDYLEKLYELFGSWDLALAAYNWGEGSVTRAMARNDAQGLPTDYLSLKMPRETRYYVPKLQAVKNIIADPERFGLELAPIPNRPYFTAITASQAMDVKLAAKFAEVPLEEFISLNPGFSRPVITQNGTQTLLLPVDKAEVFNENLENHEAPLLSWQVYRAKRGEKFDRIAARHGLSAGYLKQINGIPQRNRVAFPGQPLLVPTRKTLATADFPAISNIEYTVPKRRAVASYVVRKGDTLAGIAQRHRLSVAQLKSWNRLRGDRIHPGQRLHLRPGALAQNSVVKRRR